MVKASTEWLIEVLVELEECLGPLLGAAERIEVGPEEHHWFYGRLTGEHLREFQLHQTFLGVPVVVVEGLERYRVIGGKPWPKVG